MKIGTNEWWIANATVFVVDNQPENRTVIVKHWTPENQVMWFVLRQGRYRLAKDLSWQPNPKSLGIARPRSHAQIGFHATTQEITARERAEHIREWERDTLYETKEHTLDTFMRWKREVLGEKI